MSFSPDGTTFAAVGDGRVRLWSVDGIGLTGAPRMLGTLPGGSYAAEFTRDGTKVRLQERLWEVGLDRAVARLCAQAPAPLTPEQWSSHFPDVPYRRFCR